MNRVIAALPVDGRPAVRSQVQSMVACAGWQLRVPEVAALGHFRTPADRDALAQWLLDEGAAADGFVLSLDMLVYGGLVPSPFVPDTMQDLLHRLAVVEQIKARWPSKPVCAYAATMRISHNNVADEEKPYWAQHGQQLWAWSFHGDRAAVTGDPTNAILAQQAHDALPRAVRDDYFRAPRPAGRGRRPGPAGPRRHLPRRRRGQAHAVRPPRGATGSLAAVARGAGAQRPAARRRTLRAVRRPSRAAVGGQPGAGRGR